MPQGDVISIVESIYAIEGSNEPTWLGGIAASLSRLLGRAVPAYGLTYDASDAAAIAFSELSFVNMDSAELARVLRVDCQQIYRDSPALAQAVFRSLGHGASTSLPGQHRLVEIHRNLRALGVREILGINGVNVTGRGAHVGACLPRSTKRVGPDALARLSTHLAAAFRLCQRLALVTPLAQADAILEPNGKVLHAERDAKVKSARAMLADAGGRLDRLRATGRRRDPERALSAWRALVDGRWSLVDHFEQDGKRWVLAHRNDHAVGPFELLTHRECQVVALAALGQSNKMIGYELGIAVSTVSVLLSRASRKLGARSRRELTSAWNAAHNQS